MVPSYPDTGGKQYLEDDGQSIPVKELAQGAVVMLTRSENTGYESEDRSGETVLHERFEEFRTPPHVDGPFDHSRIRIDAGSLDGEAAEHESAEIADRSGMDDRPPFLGLQQHSQTKEGNYHHDLETKKSLEMVLTVCLELIYIFRCTWNNAKGRLGSLS